MTMTSRHLRPGKRCSRPGSLVGPGRDRQDGSPGQRGALLGGGIEAAWAASVAIRRSSSPRLLESAALTQGRFTQASVSL